jgi:membrane-bound lytic murein transglycosylase A
MKKLLALFLLSLSLTACGDATKIVPARFNDINGWREDTHAAPLSVFVDSCRVVATRKTPYQSKNEGAVGARANWQRACNAASNLGQPDDAAARQFFETYFAPYKVETESQPEGLITGYYEPILNGSKTKKAPYLTPVYGVPRDLKTRAPYFTREEIVGGALEGRAPVLLYVDDPAMLFFLHVQGSGKVRLTDGSMVGLQYAAQNGYEYVPIGRILKERGTLEQLSMQSIRDWLNDNPDEADEVMNQNPSYVFFKMGPGDKAAKGAIGLPLTPLRSIAVDDDRAAYGVPTFIDTTKMSYATQSETPLRRLFISQDTGGALKGPHRADLFYGQGDAAEWEAGHQKSRGKTYWLLPLAAPTASEAKEENETNNSSPAESDPFSVLRDALPSAPSLLP